MSKHPEILWAQRSSATDESKNVIYLTINLPEINESSLKLDIQPKEISFSAKAGRPEEQEFKFSFKLFGEVDVEKTQKRLNTRSYFLVLRKKEKKEEFWPRLTEEKKLAFVKTDFDKWVDEDEQEGAPVEDDFDMDGMGGMGGMGGLPGMGGMGGLGGMGGGLEGMGAGGMDFEKMMADMKKNSTAGVDAADSDAGSEDGDEDDGPPPLEDVDQPSGSGSS